MKRHFSSYLIIILLAVVLLSGCGGGGGGAGVASGGGAPAPPAPVPAGSITTPNTWSGSSLTVTSGSANGSVSGFSQAPAVPN
ncbi:MAG: CAP domain-containing protein, partial [Firmicutes bacterium]|nr:CAP domain-containing protein [Bacillota bacterium]